jgi:AmmeMemoRadiSam system protein B
MWVHRVDDITSKAVWQVRGGGKWFPGTKTGLLESMQKYIDVADVPNIGGKIIGVLAPHAGYLYSGKVAGYTFKALKNNAQKYGVDTVVIIGFTHGVSYPGVALLNTDIIRTPLADTEVDKDAVQSLIAGSSNIFIDERPHAMEHSAENEIPFVQYSIPGAKLVVGLIGDHDDKTIDELVAGLISLAEDKNIIVVSSTDLLHDADYDKVTETDKNTLSLIEKMNSKRLSEEWSYEHQICCGISPVIVAMQYAEKCGVTSGKVLYYQNSGDDHPESRGSWVVGYGSVIFSVSD